ncbi:MAG: hypothetical protein H6598_00925 [Flavobacteriales bacterium]|nr:hypothetical protein [Flavobacteriales bacterium]
MKKLRLLTVATLLLAGTTATFTSCGGKGGDTEETIDLNSGYGLVQEMISSLDKGKITIDKSTSSEVAKLFGIDDEDEDYISADKNFEGYRFDKSFSFEDGVLNSISCNTFYDDDKKKEAKEDSEQVLEYLKKVLGNPESSSNKYYDWSLDNYEVSFNIFDDGYSLYVNSYIEPSYDDYDDSEYDSDSDCVGDFYGLKNDLRDIFIANIKSGTIKLGKTTKAQMKTLTGDDTSFDQEYDGLRVSGYFNYNGDVLSSITLDYFYECDGAMSLLDMDKEDISSLINDGLGVTGSKDGDYDDAGTEWSISGQTVRQANFSDGYGIYLEK